jgi:hypothetical protein
MPCSCNGLFNGKFINRIIFPSPLFMIVVYFNESEIFYLTNGTGLFSLDIDINIIDEYFDDKSSYYTRMFYEYRTNSLFVCSKTKISIFNTSLELIGEVDFGIDNPIGIEVYNERLFIILKNGLLRVLNDKYSTIYSFKTQCESIDSFAIDRFENIAVLCENIFLYNLNGTLLNV